VNFEWDPGKLTQIAGSTGFHSTKPQPCLVILVSVTYPDPDHSTAEQRFITVGMSSVGRVLIVAHADRNEISRITSARKTNRSASENNMKKRTEKQERRDALHREYDLSKLKRRRSRQVRRALSSRNDLVLLSPDVAEYFPDEQSVNTALRALIRVAKRPLRRAR